MSDIHFHFSLGPVQSFVAQARRTRDFWAGSFILSWLSAVAMEAVERQGGTILFPQRDDDFHNAITGKGNGVKPAQGGVPNRFMAQVTAAFDPDQVTASVHTAWRALADHVWQKDLAGLAGLQAGTRTIWDRQVENCWEMAWVLSDSDTDTGVLDRRKNIRSHFPRPEPGARCMIMEGMQELSGHASPTMRQQIDDFWETVRGGVGLDLRKGEQLCAPAFIKRRFPRHFGTFLPTEMPGEWKLHGWALPAFVPSVRYMAAVHWLVRVLNCLAEGQDPKAPAQLRAFIDSALKTSGQQTERQPQIHAIQKAIQKAIEKSADESLATQFATLDGEMYFEQFLLNPKLYPDQDQAQNTANLLIQLCKNAMGGLQANPFYAVLLMDGDGLGKLMADPGQRAPLTQRLQQFIQAVPGIVRAHNGFLIYAGGDDVLALLPVEDALCCATALRSVFKDSFADDGAPRATISAAVQFAHVNTPLTHMLQEVQTLLKTVAKEGRGRDAIAVRINKPGGVAAEWAQPWDIALDPETGVLVLEQLAESIHQDDPGGQFSNAFFHRADALFALLRPPTEGHAVLNHEDGLALLAAEYSHSGKQAGRRMTREQAQKEIEGLATQCRPRIRRMNAAGTAPEPMDQWLDKGTHLELGGAMLTKFLIDKGMQR